MTTFVGARVFDGEVVLDGPHDVVVVDGVVAGIEPTGSGHGGETVDARGATLLPGLVDAHVHAGRDAVRHAVAFGVTTVLDMGGSTAADVEPLRRAAAEDPRSADIRSCLVGLARRDGHPHQFIGDLGENSWPTAETVEQVAGFVADQVGEGADYLKSWLEDGRLLGQPVPPLDPALLDALVRAAHRRDRRVHVHALTRESAERAVAAGADGLTHLFVDAPVTADVVARLVDAGTHVVPTLGLVATFVGDPSAAALADEPRTLDHLPAPWHDSLRTTLATLPPRALEQALAGVAALRDAGVPILAGTDASLPDMPGLAHGVSLHGELRLLVRAGLSPVEALRAATSVPAGRFGLDDRGRIAVGRRADLLLVDGDPTVRIEDSMRIRGVWRGGALAHR